MTLVYILFSNENSSVDLQKKARARGNGPANLHGKKLRAKPLATTQPVSATGIRRVCSGEYHATKMKQVSVEVEKQGAVIQL